MNFFTDVKAMEIVSHPSVTQAEDNTGAAIGYVVETEVDTSLGEAEGNYWGCDFEKSPLGFYSNRKFWFFRMLHTSPSSFPSLSFLKTLQ